MTMMGLKRMRMKMLWTRTRAHVLARSIYFRLPISHVSQDMQKCINIHTLSYNKTIVTYVQEEEWIEKKRVALSGPRCCIYKRTRQSIVQEAGEEVKPK
jgi:hypothetical protein